MARATALIIEPNVSPYGRPFEDLRFNVKYGDTIADLKNADLVVFTGGTDVSPELYGESPYRRNYSYNTARDNRERAIFIRAVEKRIPIVGICRGAQFLSVMNGGKIIQDVTGHDKSHRVLTQTGSEFHVNSTHHQMMNTQQCARAQILAWAPGLSDYYQNGSYKEKPRPNITIKEPEMVWFPDSISLACQWHPERMTREDPGYTFFKTMFCKYIGI